VVDEAAAAVTRPAKETGAAVAVVAAKVGAGEAGVGAAVVAALLSRCQFPWQPRAEQRTESALCQPDAPSAVVTIRERIVIVCAACAERLRSWCGASECVLGIAVCVGAEASRSAHSFRVRSTNLSNTNVDKQNYHH